VFFYAFFSQWFSFQQTFPDLLFDLHIYADIYSFQSAISRQWMTGNLLKKRKKQREISRCFFIIIKFYRLFSSEPVCGFNSKFSSTF